MPDQLERLRQLRRGAPQLDLPDVNKIEDVAQDAIQRAISDPPAVGPRDFVEAMYVATPDWVHSACTLLSVAFFSWFVGYLLFREVEQVWKKQGLLFPLMRLCLTVACCGFIWATMWVLVPTSVTTLRNWLCLIGGALGLISSLAYMKEKLAELIDAGRKGFEVQQQLLLMKFRRKSKDTPPPAEQ